MTKPSLRLFASVVLTVLLAASNAAAQARVSLNNVRGLFLQTSNTQWTLTKNGSENTANSTVTWTVTATKGATVSGHLTADGFLAISNFGNQRATIGNIVVNLQSEAGRNWATLSSDLADATHGNLATTVKVDPNSSSEHRGSFSTNAASGVLQFLDARNNTVFSLVPEVSIAPGATVALLYSAGFDNTVLNLPVGTTVRAEIIVSFGNATPHVLSAPDIDINGNGKIDADEDWVRSVEALVGGTVPKPVAVNSAPVLSDTASDITTTGTVTYSNPLFNLGTTSGTVSAIYAAGTSGGGITNCAHLTSPSLTSAVSPFTFAGAPGVNLQACNTQTIAAPTCTPGTTGCGWKTGDMLSYTQNDWVFPPGSTTLTGNFYSVYTNGTVEVGGTYTMTFDSADAVLSYLPANESIGVLTVDLFDTTSSSAGQFGGDVLALQLNVDFSDAGFVSGSSHLKLGDLRLCGITDLTSLNGQTVRQVLGTANTILGGGSSGSYTPLDMDSVASEINIAFENSSPTSFAQDHLVNGICQ